MNSSFAVAYGVLLLHSGGSLQPISGIGRSFAPAGLGFSTFFLGWGFALALLLAEALALGLFPLSFFLGHASHSPQT